MIAGLSNITNSSDPTSNGICAHIPARLSSNPNAMKNSTKKKSLRGLSLEMICIRNGDVANDIPANKHHISKLNPTTWNNVPSIKHNHIPISNKNSWLWASRLTSLGRMYVENKITITNNNIPSKNITPPPVSPHCRAISIRSSITTRSWTMSTHTEILPYTVCSSSLSERSLTITIVLENVSPIAINKLVIVSYPSTYESKNPIPTLAMICIAHIPSAVLPCSLITLIFSPTHTINSSKAIPKCENNSINECPSSDTSTSPNPNGHTSTHANKYHIISGCLSALVSPAMMITTTKITDNCARSDECMSWLSNDCNSPIVRLSWPIKKSSIYVLYRRRGIFAIFIYSLSNNKLIAHISSSLR